jgi:hypothetical protein
MLFFNNLINTCTLKINFKSSFFRKTGLLDASTDKKVSRKYPADSLYKIN